MSGEGRGGAAEDREPVVVKIQLEYSPGGGVWVVAEVSEDADEHEMDTHSSCLSISDLNASISKEAVLCRASPIKIQKLQRGKELYIAELLPRAWKCP